MPKTWNLNGKEFQNVMHLHPEQRYEYFIHKVADWQEIWSLWKDGWALMRDNDQQEIVPIWPHSLYADAYAVGEWTGYSPKNVPLEVWLERWTPGLERDHRLVAVFPVTDGKATTLTATQLKSDLETELEKY